MCGRYSLSLPKDNISSLLGGLTISFTLEPRFNIAPSQKILAFRSELEPVILRWGLVPKWANDSSIGYKMINARAETIAEKPSFKAAFRARRCLVPADGFYEWDRNTVPKQPYHIRMADKGLFCFAGLWESWADKTTGEIIETCALITTEANSLLKPIHHRMPVVIPPDAFSDWLEGYRVSELLTLKDWTGFERVPVSTYVNSARNEGPKCIEELEA